MEEQSKREYCFHCRRWLDGDTYYVDIAMNRYFCGAWCATNAGCNSAECVNAPKAPRPEAEPESAPTQQPLEVPDIYLSELVGVIRRALQKDGMTERLWAILDDWCDGAESYLGKKYPEAHEQAESGENVTVDWRGGACELPGLDTFIRTGYKSMSIQVSGVDMPELEPISPEEYEKLRVGWAELNTYQEATDKLIERMPNWFIPESPSIDDPDTAKDLAMRLGSYPTRGKHEESAPFTPNAFVVSVNGVEVPRGAVGYRDEANGINTDCTCRGFQGDNPTCAFHGEGTAWHDLHRGE